MQFVSKNRQAIGYESFGYVNDKVKALLVDNIVGNPETIDNGTFPITRKLWIITTDNPDAEVAAFLEFLNSQEVKDIIAACGAVPIK